MLGSGEEVLIFCYMRVAAVKKKIYSAVKNIFFRGKLAYISETADWVIKDIAQEIVQGLNAVYKSSAMITYSPLFLRKKIIHYGSVSALVDIDGRLKLGHHSNIYVLTWYHVIDNDPRLRAIPEINKYIDIVHTTCSKTANTLLEYGLDKKKLRIIPQSINLDVWRPYEIQKRTQIRKELGLPAHKKIIGSFQKDGMGWADGNDPKLEKGPDILCDTLIRLSEKNDNLHVLLTGPARGYVKQRLDGASISYTHHIVKDAADLVDYYNALDLYIVTSRVEGGPKALLESFATRTPVVSTSVGMASDVIIDEKNGMLTEIEDVSDLVESSHRLLCDKQLSDRIIQQAYIDVQEFSHEKIVKKYIDELYAPLGFT